MYTIQQISGIYLVINKTTNAIQSAWSFYEDAYDAMKRLNKQYKRYL